MSFFWNSLTLSTKWLICLVPQYFLRKLQVYYFLTMFRWELYFNWTSFRLIRASSISSMVLLILAVVFFRRFSISFVNAVSNISDSLCWIHSLTEPSRLQLMILCRTLQFWRLTDSPDSSPIRFLQSYKCLNWQHILVDLQWSLFLYLSIFLGPLIFWELWFPRCKLYFCWC